jgi:hypothetical protein
MTIKLLELVATSPPVFAEDEGVEEAGEEIGELDGLETADEDDELSSLATDEVEDVDADLEVVLHFKC